MNFFCPKPPSAIVDLHSVRKTLMVATCKRAKHLCQLRKSVFHDIFSPFKQFNTLDQASEGIFDPVFEDVWRSKSWTGCSPMLLTKVRSTVETYNFNKLLLTGYHKCPTMSGLGSPAPNHFWCIRFPRLPPKNERFAYAREIGQQPP